ncbi:alpha/beta-hydrolase [Cutaneotrichosporon oleaginosum]|uniref:Alpha/beta-hydrolase n=1 Tax=Cutaneotrichosporon oleaginosum TaxID=879819 RepID=A0A0J0XJ26_9TREE|nr:alpha/beta-hydrolase [Cutaneotrichosporon oleaginosum]KLT41105.1 alpha/beta-hydrolase [Cutaneotrichosporon oleaginosum]TXT05763.1 hypothetical protein COLE_07083 [Cutaneotrichosporon oleaginosum]
MRFHLLPLVALATAVVSRPHAERKELTQRGLGDLGAGAFAGAGAPAHRVEALQYLLHDWGYEVVSDGIWGPETAGAVTAVQPRVGLAADGVPGPATLGALVKEVAQGSRGNVVRAAQTALNGNGAQLAVDGEFGAGTKAATVAYQSARGLVADGIVGRTSWTALFGGGGGTPRPTEPPVTIPPPTDPEPTNTQPVDPDPEPTDPAPTDPQPTGPEPTDPEPTATQPTDPEPTNPQPTNPNPTDFTGGTPRTTSGPTATQSPRPLSQSEKDEWKFYTFFSKVVQCEDDKIRSWKCGPSCDYISQQGGSIPTVPVVESGSSWDTISTIFAAEQAGRLFVVVQGTDMNTTLGHYRDETQVTPKWVSQDLDGPVRIRRGHANLAQLYRNVVDKSVEKSYNGGTRDMVLVGHSQGGSIAEILGVEYKKRFPDMKITVRAFSPPKTGNGAWARAVENTIDDYRYAVAKNDRIPHEPLAEEWTHPEGEVYWPFEFFPPPDPMDWVYCPGRENNECSEGILYAFTPFTGAADPM